MRSTGVGINAFHLACVELELETEDENSVGSEEEKPEAQAPPRHLLSQNEYQKNERDYRRS